MSQARVHLRCKPRREIKRCSFPTHWRLLPARYLTTGHAAEHQLPMTGRGQRYRVAELHKAERKMSAGAKAEAARKQCIDVAAFQRR
jgi:hypothetical protein